MMICFNIKIGTDAAMLTNMRVASFRKIRYLVRKSKVLIKNEDKITSTVYCK